MSNLLKDQILSAYNHGNNFGRLLGMEFTVLENGEIEYTLKICNDHLATSSTAHGGVIAAFADALLGVGALSKAAEFGNIVSTVEFKVSYFKPVKINDFIIGRTILLKAGKSIIFMEGEIRNDRDELVAKANGTFNQYPAQKIFDTF